MPTLIDVGWGREWVGKPSTTQCISGTRFMWLQLTKDYAVNPIDRMFALLGTRHHKRLEIIAEKMQVLAQSEEKVDEAITSIIDLLEPDPLDDSGFILTDYKTAGSYKVAMALGIVQQQVVDPTGAVYQKNVTKNGEIVHLSGDPKSVWLSAVDSEKADMRDWVLQLNHYRVQVEGHNWPVSHMQVQATVRDGNTLIANRRGLHLPVYMIPIPLLPDGEVWDYFTRKGYALIEAMKDEDTMPPECSEDERWGRRKCERYCEVVEFCPEGMERKQAYDLANPKPQTKGGIA